MKMKVEQIAEFEFSIDIVPEDLVDALKIAKVSAVEMLNGTIPFEPGELSKLAKRLGMTVEELVKQV